MEDGEVGFMLRHGVATPVDIEYLNRKLKALVRNIKVGQVTKGDFLHYIYTEIRLMNDCKQIINADLTMTDNDVYDAIPIFAKLSKNIFNIFDVMFNKFPISNLSLKYFIDFCLDNKELLIRCKNYLSDITSAYHKDAEVYITVAMFMYEEYNDIEEARRHFYRGTIHHKNYKPLYIEEFSMEIQNLEKTDGATIEFALENYYSVKELFKGQMDVHFMLLDKTLHMSRVMNILNVIVEDMIMEYKHSSFMWQKLALMNEKGFIYDHMLKLVSYSYCGYCNILNCILSYELGLASVSTFSEQLQLWRMYIDHLKIFRETYPVENVQINELIEAKTPKVLQDYVNCMKRKFDNDN